MRHRKKKERKLYTGSLRYILTGKKGQKRFNIIYEDLRRFLENFFSYYEISVNTFDEFLNIVKSDLEKEQNIKSDTILAAERLSIAIKFLISCYY
jgi:hypothetical protein